MGVKSALHPQLNHIDPYKLISRQLYVFDNYTNYIHNNVRAQLPSNDKSEQNTLGIFISIIEPSAGLGGSLNVFLTLPP